MTICNIPSFLPEILTEFYDKYHVACYFLVSYQFVCITIILFNWVNYLWHFLTCSIMPIWVTIFSVDCKRFFYTLRYLYAKLVSSLPIFRLGFLDDRGALFECVRHPSYKGRFIINVLFNCVLSKINWIRVFHVFKCHPRVGSIFSLCTYFQSFGGSAPTLDYIGCCEEACQMLHLFSCDQFCCLKGAVCAPWNQHEIICSWQ